MAETHLPPLYDVEDALRVLAVARRRRDDITWQTLQVADQMAAHLARHFGPEAQETAGLAMVLAAASLGGLAAGDNAVAATNNVLAFAGQRLVADARAADDATRR